MLADDPIAFNYPLPELKFISAVVAVSPHYGLVCWDMLYGRAYDAEAFAEFIGKTEDNWRRINLLYNRLSRERPRYMNNSLVQKGAKLTSWAAHIDRCSIHRANIVHERMRRL